MPTRKALGISLSWLNDILGNNIAIIAYTVCWGVIFQCKQSQLFYLHYTIYTFTKIKTRDVND